MFSVITTVHPPSHAMQRLAACAEHFNFEMIVIGDAKGPARFELKRSNFFPLSQQYMLPFRLVGLIGQNHYARKNIGYLLAIQRAAECIHETDDDNTPMDTWVPRRALVSAHEIRDRGWINVYSYFTDVRIWPRGLPLDAIIENAEPSEFNSAAYEVLAPVQQGLANGSPDVDAIWRLIFGDEVTFRDGPSVFLPPGSWCPFNSQSTWWFPAAYPLLYLPSHCSFRMTDIWRSLVGQRCLWELGSGLVFHRPEVIQVRNPHDLMQDFEAELPGYINNRVIARRLEDLELKAGAEAMADNLNSCYEMLVSQGYLPGEELKLVRAWLHDWSTLGKTNAD